MESLIKFMKTFKCKSNCSLGKIELHDDIKDNEIFNNLILKTKDIKLLNRIIEKRPSIINIDKNNNIKHISYV